MLSANCNVLLVPTLFSTENTSDLTFPTLSRGGYRFCQKDLFGEWFVDSITGWLSNAHNDPLSVYTSDAFNILPFWTKVGWYMAVGSGDPTSHLILLTANFETTSLMTLSSTCHVHGLARTQVPVHSSPRRGPLSAGTPPRCTSSRDPNPSQSDSALTLEVTTLPMLTLCCDIKFLNGSRYVALLEKLLV